MINRKTFLTCAALFSASLTACEKKPTSIAITPPTVRMEQKGLTQTLNAIGIDKEGNKIPVKVLWKSSDDKIATVDEMGKTTAVGSGIATITAAQDQVAGNVTVNVEIATTLKLDPQTVKITQTEEKIRVIPQILNEKNAPISGKPVTFVSSDASIATVDANGVVSGLKDGTTTVTATAGALKAEVQVEVTGISNKQPETAEKAPLAPAKK